MGSIGINISDSDLGIKETWDPVELKSVTENIILTLIENNPDIVENFYLGSADLMFVAEVMRQTDGAADPVYAAKYLADTIVAKKSYEKNSAVKISEPIDMDELQEAVNKITGVAGLEQAVRPINVTGPFRRADGYWETASAAVRPGVLAHSLLKNINEEFIINKKNVLNKVEEEHILKLLKKSIDSQDESYVNSVIENSLQAISNAGRYKAAGVKMMPDRFIKEIYGSIKDSNEPSSIVKLSNELRSSSKIDTANSFNNLVGEKDIVIPEEIVNAWKEGDYKTIFGLHKECDYVEGEDDLKAKQYRPVIPENEALSKILGKDMHPLHEKANDIKNMHPMALKELYKLLGVAPCKQKPCGCVSACDCDYVEGESDFMTYRPVIPAQTTHKSKYQTLSDLNDSVQKVASSHLEKDVLSAESMDDVISEIAGELTGNFELDVAKLKELQKNEDAKRERRKAWLQRNNRVTHSGSTEFDSLVAMDKVMDNKEKMIELAEKGQDAFYQSAYKKALDAHDLSSQGNTVKRNGEKVKSATHDIINEIKNIDSASSITDTLLKEDLLKDFRKNAGTSYLNPPISRDGTPIESKVFTGKPADTLLKKHSNLLDKELSKEIKLLIEGLSKYSKKIDGTSSQEPELVQEPVQESTNSGFEKEVPMQWISTVPVEAWEPPGDSIAVHDNIVKKIQELEIDDEESRAVSAYAALLKAKREFINQKNRLNSFYKKLETQVGDSIE